MRTSRRRIALLLTGLFLLSLAASCSDKGVRMPKHRKRRHCDCPTFAQSPSPAPAEATLQGGVCTYSPYADPAVRTI